MTEKSVGSVHTAIMLGSDGRRDSDDRRNCCGAADFTADADAGRCDGLFGHIYQDLFSRDDTVVDLQYRIRYLRAVGDAKRPLYFLIAACFTNIVLDLLFVVVFHWGVAGAGIATVMSQCLSAVLVCLVLSRSTESYRVMWHKVRFDSVMLPRIIRIGIPAGLQSVMYNAANIVVQTSMNTFGTDNVASWTVFEKMDGIYWLVVSAFGVAVTTFVGQNFGARKFERVKKSVRVSLAMCLSIAIGLSILLICLCPYIFLLFTSDTAVLQGGIFMVHFMMPAYFIYVFTEIPFGCYPGNRGCFYTDADHMCRRMRSAYCMDCSDCAPGGMIQGRLCLASRFHGSYLQQYLLSIICAATGCSVVLKNWMRSGVL